MNQMVTHLDLESNDSVDNQAEYELKTKYFANNTVDFVMTKIKHRIPKLFKEFSQGTMISHTLTLTDEQIEAKRLENIERSARRAKQAVHYLCRGIGADHMLTLTTRENIESRDEFYKIFTRFIRLVKTKSVFQIDGVSQLVTTQQNSRWAYVAVPELQERGAFHMHIACVGKQDLKLLRACWYVALGGDVSDTGVHVKGQIDVQSNVRRFSGETENFKTFKLVSYLTKYITKSFDSQPLTGIHRYKAARNLPSPIIHNQYLMSCFSIGKDFTDAMKEVIGIADFVGVKGDYQLWNRGDDIFILRGELLDD